MSKSMYDFVKGVNVRSQYGTSLNPNQIVYFLLMKTDTIYTFDTISDEVLNMVLNDTNINENFGYNPKTILTTKDINSVVLIHIKSDAFNTSFWSLMDKSVINSKSHQNAKVEDFMVEFNKMK